MKYCVRDCTALLDIERHIDFTLKNNCMADALGLPFSSVYHRTGAQAVTTFMQSGLFREGVETNRWSSVELDKFEEAAAKFKLSPEEIDARLKAAGIKDPIASYRKPYKFAGALNLERTRAIFSECITCQRDYSSLYPSVMLAFCISPMTYNGTACASELTSKDHINDICIPNDPRKITISSIGDDDPISRDFVLGVPQISEKAGHEGETVYLCFRNEPDHPFFKQISTLLANRKKWRELKDNLAYGTPEYAHANQMQLALKVAVNSLYGGLGSPVNPLFRHEASVAVALAARHCLMAAVHHLRGLKRALVYADTDSTACNSDWSEAITLETYSSFKAREEELTDALNAGIREQIAALCPGSYVNHLGMTLETDKFMIRAIHPIKKKTYAYISRQMAVDRKTGEPSIKEAFHASGLQYSQVSTHVIKRTEHVIEQILRTGASHADEMIREFIVAELARIKPETIADYASVFKVTSDAALAAIDRWPEYRDHSRVLRLVPVADPSIREAVRRWVPVEYAAEFADVLDRGKMIQLCFTKNIGRLFPQAATIACEMTGTTARTFAGKIIVSDGSILVRRDIASNSGVIREKPRGMSVKEITNALRRVNAVTSLHECPDQSANGRLYLDVDVDLTSNPELDLTPARLADQVNARILAILGRQIDVAALSASNAKKISLHLIYAISMPFDRMLCVATEVKKSIPWVDTAVYATNHSMRLPLCNKVGETRVDERPFLLIGGNRESTIARIGDCLIGNLRNADGTEIQYDTSVITLPPRAMISGPFTSAFNAAKRTIDGKMSNELLAACATFIGVTPADLVVQVGYNGADAAYWRVYSRIVKPCAVCGPTWTHDHEHYCVSLTREGWTINCFACMGAAARCKNPVAARHVILPVARSDAPRVKIQTLLQAAVDSLPSWQSRRPEVHAGYLSTRDDMSAASDADLIFVRASCGAGKTYWFEHFIAANCGSTLALTARRAFSVASTRRFKEHGFTNYMDTLGRLEFGSKSRMFLQMDSLARLDHSSGIFPDMLLLDEIEALQVRLVDCGRTSIELTDLFIKLIQGARRIVVLDAGLSDASIAAIRAIRGTSAPYKLVTHNTAPFAGKTMKLRVTDIDNRSGHAILGVVSEMLQIRAERGPLACFCHSQCGVKYIQKRFLEAGYRILMYHGRDLEVISGVGEARRSMYACKVEDLADLSSVVLDVKPDLLIYTSTISVGISIECKEYFACAYTLFADYIDVGTCYQAMQRVRQFNADFAIINLSPRRIGGDVQSVADALTHYASNPVYARFTEQYLASLSYGHSQLKANWIPVLMDLLWGAGASFEVIPPFEKPNTPVPNPMSRETPSDIAQCKLTQEQADELDRIRMDERRKANVVDDTMLFAEAKWRIMRKLGMTVDEVNQLDAGCIAAGQMYIADRMSEFGTRIGSEPDFSSKCARLAMILHASRYPRYDSECLAPDGIRRVDVDVVIEAETRRLAVNRSKETTISLAAAEDIILSSCVNTRSTGRAVCRLVILRDFVAAARTAAVNIGDLAGCIEAPNFAAIAKDIAEKRAALIRGSLGDAAACNMGKTIVDCCVAAGMGIDFMRRMNGEFWLVFRDIAGTAAVELSANGDSHPRSIIRRCVCKDVASEASLIAEIDGIDMSEPGFAQKIASIASDGGSQINIARRWLRIVMAAWLKYDDEMAKRVTAELRQHIEVICMMSPTFTTNGMYPALREILSDPADRKMFFVASRESVENKHRVAAEKVSKAAPRSDAGMPSTGEMIALAREYIAGTRSDAGILAVAMYLTGARLAEIPRASLTNEGGAWMYRGCSKGHLTSDMALKMRTLADPEVSAAILEKAREYCLANGCKPDGKSIPSSITKRISVVSKRLFGSHATKDFRIIGAMRCAQEAAVRLYGEAITASRVEALNDEHLHHQVADAHVATHFAYRNVRLD